MTTEDYDTGFVCKACGQWFADKDVKHWDTKWTEPDDGASDPSWRSTTSALCVAKSEATFQTKAFSEGSSWGKTEITVVSDNPSSSTKTFLPSRATIYVICVAYATSTAAQRMHR